MATDPVENSTENTENKDLQNNPSQTGESSAAQEEQANAPKAAPQETENPKSSEEIPSVDSIDTSAETIATDAGSKESKERASDESTGESAKAETSEKSEASSGSDTAATQKLDEIFAKLKEAKEQNGSVEVEVHSRIRGGLRVMYDIMPMFLPASHFSLSKSPSEDELNAVVGQKINVRVHEMEEDETGRKTVIVSRRDILESDFWDTLKVGEKVKGVVTSIAPFGVFINLGLTEGLIHVSRLANMHITDPKTFVKKGDELEAIIIDVDKKKKRIALSHKEFTDSPWTGVSEEFPEGTIVKGIARRVTDFGVYVELKPGIDGLLRTGEISWTKRFKKPSEVIQKGQEIEVMVVDINETKQTATLSIKRLSPSPWPDLEKDLAEGTVLKGKVVQVMEQGCIVNVEGDIDAFMPKSKARPILKGNKLPFDVGSDIEVVVADVVSDDESLIIAPKIDEDVAAEFEQNQKNRQNRQQRQQRRPESAPRKSSEPEVSASSFSFGDLLSDKAKDKLKNLGN